MRSSGTPLDLPNFNLNYQKNCFCVKLDFSRFINRSLVLWSDAGAMVEGVMLVVLDNFPEPPFDACKTWEEYVSKTIEILDADPAHQVPAP